MSFSMGSFGDIVTAAELAMKIVKVLYYSPKASEDYQGVLTELVSLHHELVLINDAIQLDTSAGLGAVARESVLTEVACCHIEMQRFLAKTEGVTAKGITGILNKVWWAASEEKDLRSLRAAISRRRAALGVLIGSSNLIISTTTRDEVRACRDSIQELSTMLKPVPHHILEDMVFIVDPLGDIIRVSMIYGLKYEDLHRIIRAYYPTDRAGSRHISEGAYHLLHSDDGLISQPSKSTFKLRTGMTLEMSMVLRERANFLEHRRTCPRCKRQANSEIVPQTSWRKCLRCSKFFQVILDDSLETQRWTKAGCSFRATVHANILPSHFSGKQGPKPANADDDGIEHFRRIEFICIEDRSTVRFVSASKKPSTATFSHQVHMKKQTSMESLKTSFHLAIDPALNVSDQRKNRADYQNRRLMHLALPVALKGG